MSNDIYSVGLRTIIGKETTFGDYEGQVALIVNVASKCGLTKQYNALEKIYENYRDQGFVVLGFPSNEFANQEPGSDEEIRAFCLGSFGIRFPLFSKIEVNGTRRHPLYRHLIAAQPEAKGDKQSSFHELLNSKGYIPKKPEDILWNFEKFLVDRNGQVVQRFAPDIAPDDARVVKAIDAALAQ